ncbi:cytochrome P450 [Chlamydoabsidia padenii]|nr:cytochrome P450 [Chlamydoabsidia padenii]
MENIQALVLNVNSRLALPRSRNNVLSIGAALSLVLAYWAVDRVVRPPKKLRHIPYINFFQYLYMMMIQRKPLAEVSKALIVPLVSNPASQSIYLRPDRLGWMLHIANPVAAKKFFLKTDVFGKADLSAQKGSLLHDFLGENNILMATQKEEWKKHRKLVNPAFHKSKPVKLFATLGHKTFKVLDSSNEQPVDIGRLMERYTLEVIGAAGFGFDFDSILDENNKWVETYYHIKSGVNDPLFFFFPLLDQKFLWLFPERRRKHEALQRFLGMLDDVIEKKRRYLQSKEGKMDESEDVEKDLLTLMLEGELSGEGVLTNEELKSNLNVFFIAGHDTTANALSFAIHALARDPVLQQQARDEVISVLGDAPENIFPTSEDTKQLDLLNRIIKENLRLHGPAVVGTPRKLRQDTEVAGFYVPKDTPVTVNIYDLHHNPTLWDDPETFDPSRFADGGESDQKAGGGMSYAPFYNGQRMCIGMQFSLDEQRVMLSCLLRKYEWYLPENSEHKDRVITGNVGLLTPVNLKVIFKRRY